MASKTSEWRPGPTVCRCCLNEGCYKDISTEYFWMGKREVYAEMLTETLDLTVAYSTAGGPNSNSRLICETCIARLRDASDFKRQVQECERTFLQYIDPGSSVVIAETIEALDASVKVEGVKEEKVDNDDHDDIDDTPDFDNDDDYDDLDDEPLTKLASKTPKEESVDALDLLDNAKPAKRKATIKLKSSATKKAKPKKVEPTSSKPKPEKKKKEETHNLRRNAELIIKNTTASPFRVNDKSVLCVYCQELYDDPELFRQHMIEEHETYNLNVVFYRLPKLEFIKADITNLKCRQCGEAFGNLEPVGAHLKEKHNEDFDLDSKVGVMPFFLQRDAFSCAVCQKSFPTLLHLNRHTISHFFSYVCHVCGKSYNATTGLLRHVRTKHQDYAVPCKRCNQMFPSIDAKDKHKKTQKSCLPYGCSKCSERFLDWNSKKRHMEAEHGQSKKIDRCADCDQTFVNGHAYYSHFKLKHSADCVVCKYCGAKFASRCRLQRHITKHNC